MGEQGDVVADRRPAGPVGDATVDPLGPARKPSVGIEGFEALDLRVGTIVEVRPFPEARAPAWRLRVDFGPVVGVLATSAQVTNYPASELLGRSVVGAINLGDKRIAGFRSECLILGGLGPDRQVRLLSADGPLPPGTVVA